MNAEVPRQVCLGTDSQDTQRTHSIEDARFERLFADYSPFVWRSLLRLGVRRADVPDVAQIVFLALFARLSEAKILRSHRAYIYSVCVRQATRYRGRAHVRREVFAAEASGASVQPHAEEALDRRRSRELLDRLLGQLTDSDRELLVLCDIESLPVSEAASALGCALPTAYARLARARRRLKAAFTRHKARCRHETQARTRVS